MSGFFDYYLRCKEADRPQLMALAELLGILRKEGGAWVPCDPRWVWVEVGTVYRPAGDNPEAQEPARAPDGSVWWHANLRLTMDLLEHAQAVYAAAPTPELAAGLADVGCFFITDASGRAARPDNPAVVFA